MTSPPDPLSDEFVLNTFNVPHQALEDALEGMMEMIHYVPDYFIDKWNLSAYVIRAQRTLRGEDVNYKEENPSD